MHTTHAEMLPALTDFLNASVVELQTTGECAQSVILFRETLPVVGIMVDFRDPEHKTAAWKAIIDTADAFGCDAAGLILDAYCGCPDSGLAPSEDPAAGEALLIATCLPGTWSWTMLRYGRNDDGSVHFSPFIEPATLDNGLDAMLPRTMAMALDDPIGANATDAKVLVSELIELGATVGLMPAYA